MGFFSSIGGLFGGSESQSGGFNALPEAIKGTQKTLSRNVYETLLEGRGDQYFVPLAETADETRAFDMIREGFTPTEESLGRDISMLTNPFDRYVIDDINKEAMGDYSVIKQAVSDAGQFGSNRQILGAGEIEDTRLSNVGKFRQDQYNKTLDYAINTLPAMRANDAAGLLGIGEFQRDLDYRTKQAPVSNLLTAAQITGTLPKTEGGSSSTNYGNGILGNVSSAVGSWLAAGGGG